MKAMQIANLSYSTIEKGDRNYISDPTLKVSSLNM